MSQRGSGISQGNNGPRRSTRMKVAFNITSKSEPKDMTKSSPNNMWAPENLRASLTTEKWPHTHSHMTTHDEMTLTQAHTDVFLGGTRGDHMERPSVDDVCEHLYMVKPRTKHRCRQDAGGTGGGRHDHPARHHIHQGTHTN